jgi:hypothetical protein
VVAAATDRRDAQFGKPRPKVVQRRKFGFPLTTRAWIETCCRAAAGCPAASREQFIERLAALATEGRERERLLAALCRLG